MKTVSRTKLALLFSLLLTAGAFPSLAGAAEIRGKISPVVRLRSLEAIERTRKKRYQAAVDWQAGGFALRDLPLGTYDLVVTTKDATIEGVNLEVTQPSGAAEKSPSPLAEKDIQRIGELIKHMKTFEEHKRILLLEGRDNRARVLVELMRTGKTTLASSKSFVVWRVEVWDYVKLYGTWRRKRGLGEVIERKRLEKAAFTHFNWLFDPVLGGITLTDSAEIREFDYQIPEELSTLPGRYQGRESPLTRPQDEAAEEKASADQGGK